MVASPEYSLRTQAKIPPALGALHNYIHIHDPDDDAHEDDDYDSDAEEYSCAPPDRPLHPEDLGQHISEEEKDWATERRDAIAMAMWENYIEEQCHRGEL